MRSLVELVFEVDSEGGLATDLERLQIGLPISDRSVLWFGRFHTQFGSWHTGFHHGAQLQTAINRPRFLDFEDKGGMLPAHSVGLWWAGNMPVAAGRFYYNLYLANGNQIATSPEAKLLDFNAANDNNNGKLLGGSISYQWDTRLEAGLHAYRDSVETYPNGDVGMLVSSSAVKMGGAFVKYDDNKSEVMAEWYHFANNTEILANGAPGGLGRHKSDLWFVQAGQRFWDWMPYVRVEQAKLDANDAYFNSMDSGQPYKRGALGLRYDWNAHTSFKFELTHTREAPIAQLDTSAGVGSLAATAAANYTRLQLQTAISF